MRTVWTFQVFIASTVAWSAGPSHMPLPWMQANSPLDRLTPSSRYAAPVEVTRWLPETCSAGAGVGGGVLVGGVVVGVVGGVVGPDPPHITPLTVNAVGAALASL